MTRNHRSRRLASAATLAVVLVALAACTTDYPNTTFEHTTDFNTAIDGLWDTLLLWGTVVFVFVEAILVYTIIRFRRREGAPPLRHVHGNTTLEILWTLIPVVILALIAVPTVQTIFRTQAKAPAGALQVEVIGHQWWWEFRYPQYGVVTANELYLPLGRTANFSLRTADVLHSFWIPRLGGKRDLITNHTNYLWFTPDSSLGANTFNGSCNEFCGASHANMRFRAFTVSPAEFERWAAHQKSPARFLAPVPASPATASSAPASGAKPASPLPPITPPAEMREAAFVFPGTVPVYAIPDTPVPDGLTFAAGLVGDPERGRATYSSSACIGCHMITGNPVSMGVMGPNLTHVGSRFTIGAGLYPNDTRHLALWIKNARRMKPGSVMPTLGKGQYDPITTQTMSAGALDDQQIADIVAYLQALK